MVYLRIVFDAAEVNDWKSREMSTICERTEDARLPRPCTKSPAVAAIARAIDEYLATVA